MVGLMSPYCPSRLMTSKSTCSIDAKCLQLRINFISLSKHKHSFLMNSGLRRRMADNSDPKHDGKVGQNEGLFKGLNSRKIRLTAFSETVLGNQ